MTTKRLCVRVYVNVHNNQPAVSLSPDVDTDESRLTENPHASVRLAAVVDVLAAHSKHGSFTFVVLRTIHRQPGVVESHVVDATYSRYHPHAVIIHVFRYFLLPRALLSHDGVTAGTLDS